ncbi:hypothetical protein GCM10007320_58290 [Pseudorhodoferax aquiterrae]|uniref:Uncharacterized protein n=1 Tax=Pseudorhodoferax aquiterrae TaxID=747304 RepID=A0ABQ3GCT6_9BURK|nr:hypothetical protein GCM10007320_58290 [Pseudorhodoferax aquiterrae]
MPTLFVLDDVAADLEAGTHLDKVNAACHGLTSGKHQRVDTGIERVTVDT